MRGAHHDGDAARAQHVLDRVGDLRRQLLLDLQALGVELDHPRDLGDADNIVERQLTLRDQAAIDRQEMSGINKKIHAFGGEAMLFDHISEGKTVNSVIKSLDISIGGFYKWIEKDAKRGELLARARTRGGRSLAEQTLEIADAATPQDAQVAKLRVDTRRWLASQQAPDEYGDKQQPLVNIDLGSMALDALRKRSVVSLDDSA